MVASEPGTGRRRRADDVHLPRCQRRNDVARARLPAPVRAERRTNEDGALRRNCSLTQRLHLFDPLALRGLTLANRIVVSPMCQYSAVDGRANDWHLVHWGQLLQSGAGMFTIEATAVTRDGRITHGCLGLYDDACETALATTLARARQQAPAMPVAMQLAHAGRKALVARALGRRQADPVADGGWTPVAPSAIPHSRTRRRPPRSTPARSTRSATRSSPRRSARSAPASTRSSCTGARLSAARIPLAALQPPRRRLRRRSRRPHAAFRSRSSTPCALRGRSDKPMGVRISAIDWVDGGMTLDDSIELARRLVRARLRLDRRVERRRVAGAEDPARSRLPGAARARDSPRDRRRRRWRSD